ncbi:hypothetical protein GCM10017559_80170 [Streptosporangium longisporum]|uniref:Carrier domain-containing protein n=1 Tax=Streptosporangium longisporum TaxID=46187 RepID=A0ABP6LGN1_9ACTN
MLVGYVVPAEGPGRTSGPASGPTSDRDSGPASDRAPGRSPGRAFDRTEAAEHLRRILPAALVPRIVVVDDLPTRTSGKIDRDALPWPPPGGLGGADGSGGSVAAAMPGVDTWVAGRWTDVLGGAEGDFFAEGGTSLAAARLVAALRERYPAVTVGDVYDNPTLPSLDAHLSALDAPEIVTTGRTVAPVPRRAAIVQAVLTLPLLTVGALRWVVALAALNNVVSLPWAPAVSWWWVLAGALLFVSPAGRIALAAGGARLLLRGLEPGTHPRGGGVHLRLWFAERLSERLGVARWPAHPGSPTTRGRSAPRSARTPTCTRCRRSPACSSWAGARRWNPRPT